MARSTVPTSPRAESPAHPGLRIVALALLALAVLLACWLTFMSFRNGAVPGCEGAGCASVLTSKWAKVFGVPVGVLGAAAYAILAILGARPIPANARWARIVGAALVLLIPSAALWFAALQLFVLKAFCPWCTATHVLGTLGAFLMAAVWRRDQPVSSHGRKASKAAKVPSMWAGAAALAGVAFGGLMLMQWLSPTPPAPRVITTSMSAPTPTSSSALTNPIVQIPVTGSIMTATVPAVPPPAPAVDGGAGAPARLVSMHNGRFQLDPHELPVMGSPDAEKMMVMLSDYTCRYCRAAYKLLHEVRDVFDSRRLGIVSLPSHHGGESLEIQRLMLAAWKADPAVWAHFSDELYSERLALKPAAVREALEQRLPAGQLDASLAAHEKWITNVVAQGRELHAANRAKAGSGSIPQFVIGQEIVVGAPSDTAEFFQLLSQHLGLVRDLLPELVAGSPAIDLGRVFAGTVRPMTIPISNSGRAELQLTRANLPKGSRVIRGLQVPVPPGRTSALDIGFSVPQNEGPFDETLTLFSNARVAATPVQVRGSAWRPLTITPQVLDFGRLDAENSSTQGVLRIEFSERAAIASVRSQNPGFSATLLEVTPGRVYEVEVATTSSLGSGAQQGAVLVSLEKPVPAGWPETLVLGARARVERGVTVAPSRIVLPTAQLTTDRYHQVMVRCLDAMAGFAVTGAIFEGGPAFLQPEIERAGGTNSFTVQITIPAGWSLPRASENARLVIQTNHPRYPTLDVPLVAQGTP